MNFPEYSVLMSVYAKENPVYLREAVESMLVQTIPPSEFVIVEDGPLTEGLYEEIRRFTEKHSQLFKIVSYGENHGLGYALREGVLACTKGVIARMDSDDYSKRERMERQLLVMVKDGLDMVGSQVSEFAESPDRPIAFTNLPESNDEIVAYSKRRNPFRHPPMTFKREKVLEAGNYSSEFLYFEDWDLFNRMLAIGCKSVNIHEPLVAMRVSEDFYARRGGLAYLQHAWHFKFTQYKRAYFSLNDLIISTLPQVFVCIMPNALRSFVYMNLLRKETK